MQNTKKRKATKRKANSVNSKGSSVKKRKPNPSTTGAAKKKLGNGTVSDGKVNNRKTSMERKAKSQFLTTLASGTIMSRVQDAGQSINEIRKDVSKNKTLVILNSRFNINYNNNSYNHPVLVSIFNMILVILKLFIGFELIEH